MPTDHMTFLEHEPTKRPVSLLGIPIDLGKDSIGTDEGPDHLRKFGVLQMLEHVGVKFEDLGNIKCPTRELSQMGDKRFKYLKEIVAVGEKTAQAVYDSVVAGRVVVALGGDHSLTMGTVAGASVACHGDVGVIYIDAHGDMMTHENTLSGNVHGMPASALMGFGHPELVNIFKPGRKVKPENFLFVGLKDLDQGEIDLIRSERLHVVTMFDILQNGFQCVTREILELQKRVKHIWVSVDLDAIDSQYAPATPILNQGGLSYREVTSLAKYIGKVCNLVGMDIVELAPRLDSDEKTTKMATTIVANMLGAEYGWYSQYMNHEAEKQSERGITISVDDKIRA